MTATTLTSAVQSEFELPSYNQVEDESSLRFCIVVNPKTEAATSRRVITLNPVSSTGIFNDLSGTRAYYPKYQGLTKFTISSQTSARPSITYFPKSKDLGHFELSHPPSSLYPTRFDLEARCNRVKIPHVNTLLERFPPLQLKLTTRDQSSGGFEAQQYSWRAVPPQKSKKSKSQNIDLVLLDQDFKEYAYFRNQLGPVTENDNNVWGILEVKQGLADDLLVDQIVLSLLALIHVYKDKATYAGRWSDVAVGMLSGSVMCQVM